MALRLKFFILFFWKMEFPGNQHRRSGVLETCVRRTTENCRATVQALIWPHEHGVVKCFLLRFLGDRPRQTCPNLSCGVTIPIYLGHMVDLLDTGHPFPTFQVGPAWSGSWTPSRTVAALSPDHLIHQREGPVIENISYFQVFPDMRTIPSLWFFVNLFSSRRGMWNQNQLRLGQASQAVVVRKPEKCI